MASRRRRAKVTVSPPEPSVPGHRTPRGQRTRAALLKAGRTVFEEDGFVNARISDIADRAGFAHGTFYTYFPSKEAIFQEIALGLQQSMFFGSAAPDTAKLDEDWVGGIERANRRYLAAYRENAALMGIIEQVSLLNDEIRAIRQERVDAFISRAISQIQHLMDRGLIDEDLDPTYVAIALTSMVSRYAYVWFVDSTPVSEKLDFEESVTTLTILWARALGLDMEPWLNHRRAEAKRPPAKSGRRQD